MSVIPPVSAPRRLRSPLHALGIPTGPLRRVFLATLVNAIGNGMTLTLFVVYLTKVRGFHIGQATAVLAVMSVVGLACSPLAGTLIDKFGARPLLLVSLPMMAVCVTANGHINSLTSALFIGCWNALASGGNWSAQSTLMTRMVDGEQRQRMYGVNFMILNFGIGAGGLISASIVSLSDPSTFETLYLIDGCSFLLVWGIIASLRGHGGPSPALVAEDGSAMAQRGWSHVAKDVLLRRYLVAALLLMICGYGNMEAGLSYFVTTTVHLPVSRLGIIMAANTAAIVVAQVFMLKRIQGRSRTGLMIVVSLLWAASWALNASSAFMGVLAATVVLCLGQVVFAVGETIWAPVAPAIINDLADEDVRGRYNSAQAMLWTVAGTLAPMFAGAFLQRGNGFLWISSLVVGCLLAAVAFADLKRRVSAKVDGLGAASSTDPADSASATSRG